MYFGVWGCNAKKEYRGQSLDDLLHGHSYTVLCSASRLSTVNPPAHDQKNDNPFDGT